MRKAMKEAMDKQLGMLSQLTLTQLLRIAGHAEAWGVYAQWAGYTKGDKG